MQKTAAKKKFLFRSKKAENLYTAISLKSRAAIFFLALKSYLPRNLGLLKFGDFADFSTFLANAQRKIIFREF